MIQINMSKAREIHKAKLREMRAPLLADLDIAFMRAVEAGDTQKQAEVAAKKQALRDATADPIIAQAQTPEELKMAIPHALASAAES